MAIKKQAQSDDPRLSLLSSRALLQRALRRDPDGQAYWKIVSLLHKRGDRSTFEAAIALCRDQRPRARRLSADVLGQFGAGAGSAHPFASEAATALLQVLPGEEEPEALSSLICALGWTRDPRAIEPLLRFKTHPSEWVRWSLVDVLSCCDDEAALQSLIELTRDADEWIRDWATFGLSNKKADTPALRQALAARLDDSDAQTHVEAMVGLAERGDARVIEAVLRALEPDEAGRVLFDGLDDTPDYRLLPALRAMAKSEPGRSSPELRAAIRACEAFGRRL